MRKKMSLRQYLKKYVAEESPEVIKDDILQFGESQQIPSNINF